MTRQKFAGRRGDGWQQVVDDPSRTPLSMISGTEPQRNARAGVPHAIASIITSPKGSGQSTGNNRAAASQELRLLVLVDFADEFHARTVQERAISSRK